MARRFHSPLENGAGLAGHLLVLVVFLVVVFVFILIIAFLVLAFIVVEGLAQQLAVGGDEHLVGGPVEPDVGLERGLARLRLPLHLADLAAVGLARQGL